MTTLSVVFFLSSFTDDVELNLLSNGSLEDVGVALWLCIRSLFCFMLQVSIFAYKRCKIEFLDSFGDAMWLCIRSLSVLCWSRLSSCADDVKLNLLSNERLEIFGDALCLCFGRLFSVFVYRRCRLEFAIEWKIEESLRHQWQARGDTKEILRQY